MKIGFLEPHLRCYGGIRRVLELANRMVDRGHEVTFFLPPDAELQCTWMECRALVRSFAGAEDDPLDVLLFNHEPQWYLIPRFTNVRRRVFYVLHYAALYDKAGVWESLRFPVDLRLANSHWTAEQAARECGSKPLVLLGGVNPDHFRPLTVRKKWPVLAYGDRTRAWKGTDDIDRACARLGITPEFYAGKGYPQTKMAHVYGAAEVFVTGSWYEGFCQPGLEALACATPLVTTDCGGAGEYAIHEETALVVPPRDPVAMSDAIVTLREDAELRLRLSRAGLALVAERFSWERNTERLVQMLNDLLEENREGVPGDRPRTEAPIVPRDSDAPVRVTVGTLVWDGLDHTQAFAESVRRYTNVPYELVMVDNGSQPLVRDYVSRASDACVLNDENRGFAGGMNQVLELARGEFIAFMNNDTRVPTGWIEPLLETLELNPRAGIVAPVVTAAASEVSVREAPGDRVLKVAPFDEPPPAVVFVMRTEVARALGGFGHEFPIASAEDVDLCFKAWCNGLDVFVDERVLVHHVSKGTARAKLEDWESVWDEHRLRFLDKWTADDVEVPFLEVVPRDEFDRLRRCAGAAAFWMRRYFEALDILRGGEKRKGRRAQIRRGDRPQEWKRNRSGRRSFLQKKWMSLKKRTSLIFARSKGE